MSLCGDESGAYAEPRVLLCGETAISVEFGDKIDLKINRKVRHLYKSFKAAPYPGILDINPTYCSLFIRYDPLVCSLERLLLIIEEKLDVEDAAGPDCDRIIDIPVCYESEFALDIRQVADFHGMHTGKVIELHTAPVYHVYMIGFILGFPYLGELDHRLHTPRKKDPRKTVAAGSVGIAGRQTGIYPVESPGGWQIIGITPVRIFDPARKEPFLLEMGDTIRFKAITRDEFHALSTR
ncbi:Allophanate hydrolase subunit 1 [Syntrophobacter sp. SbD1]|nr:Allophanate hydrolase subunit 1 [Syntrophobacter sp. SbD1]